MKSLEIVNDYINLIDNFEFDKCYVGVNELQQIKQDLEVLEIISKKMSISKYGVFESKNNGAVVEYNRITTSEIKEDEFDREKFNKVKQWLERGDIR